MDVVSKTHFGAGLGKILAIAAALSITVLFATESQATSYTQGPLTPEGPWQAARMGCMPATPAYYTSPSGGVPQQALNNYVAALNTYCSGRMGANWTATHSLGTCNPTFVESNGNGNAFAVAYGCIVNIYVTPKPSCTGTCTPWNGTENAPSTTTSCKVPLPPAGTDLAIDVIEPGGNAVCNCPKNMKYDPVSGRCLPFVDLVLKLCLPCAVTVGNPIYPGTGNKRQEETDYTGNGPLPLTFRRVYNSRTSDIEPWTHTFNRYVTYAMESGGVGSAVATLHRPEGDFVFTKTASTGWIADVGNNFKLAGGNGTFNVTSEDGSEKEWYNAKNQVYQIQTYNGTTKYSLVYSTASTPPAVAPKADLLLSVSDPHGRSLQFNYDSAGRMAGMANPAGGMTQYSYDTNGNLASVTYPDATVRQYVYNEPVLTSGANLPNALTGIIDENGVRFANFGYTATGLANLTEYAGGAQRYSVTYTTPPSMDETIVYDGAGKPLYIKRYHLAPGGVAVTDGLGAARSYVFAVSAGAVMPTSASLPCQGVCTPTPLAQSYDANGNPASRTDFNGVSTTYVFDLARNLQTSRSEAVGTPQARTITTAWHSTLRLPTQTVEAGRTNAITYDGNGYVTSRTVTDTSGSPNVSRTWTYSLGSFGMVTGENGPRTDVSDITSHTYASCTTGFQCGRRLTTTNELGQVTTYNTYDAHGLPTKITDPNGVITSVEYDNRQRLSKRCANALLPGCAGGELTTVEYWPTGLIKKVTLPDGAFSSYAYDSAHRLVQVGDTAGNHANYTLDALGNRLVEDVYDPLGNLRRTHSRVFDARGRIYQDIDAASTGGATTSYGYDANGNQLAVQAPLGRTTANQYDGLNRLKQITDPASGTAYLAYNARDDLTSVTDPRGLVTSYVFNGFGQATSISSPDSGNTSSTYDSAGNLKTSIDARGAVSTYTYDATNRVTNVSYKIGAVTDQSITYVYEQGVSGKGHLTSASDANHSMSWAFDAYGRPVSKSVTVGAVARTVGYAYSNGRLTTLTLPSGNAVTYGYDPDGRVVSIAVGGTSVLQGATYEAMGSVSGWTWGNGSTHSRTYDQNGRITAISTSHANGVNLAYGYDAASRSISQSDSGTSPNSWIYGYDLLGRLTSAQGPTQTQGWSYDANGNRLTETGTQATTFAISATSNRLSGTSGFLNRTYSYDAAGNALTYEDVTLGYNYRNRLKSVQKGVSTKSYLYDAMGQLVRSSGGAGGTVHYVYDESGRLLGEYDASGATIQETIWLGDIPVATVRPGANLQIFHVHSDALGAPVSITEPVGNARRWQWRRDPFGTLPANENPESLGSFGFDVRFPGQIFDGQAGLHQNFFRDYSPAIGRYVESDPIGLHGGINTYAYANANPATFVDPDGRNPGAVARGGWVIGRVAGAGLNRALVAATGTTLGGLIYEMCNDDSEEARCKKVYKGCADGCADIYADNPDRLPGTGSDLASRVRRCIAECVKAAGCSPFTGR